jgi:hypothetical protein
MTMVRAQDGPTLLLPYSPTPLLPYSLLPTPYSPTPHSLEQLALYLIKGENGYKQNRVRKPNPLKLYFTWCVEP